MRRTSAIALIILAGSQLAPCQDAFVVHFDSVQAGYDALGRSVMETGTGYLVFAHQVSNDGTGRTRCVVYSLGQGGAYQWHNEIGTGEPSHSGFGFFDPVIRNGTQGYKALVQRFNYFDTEIELLGFDSEGNVIDTAMVMSTLEEDSTIVGVRQLRRTSEGGFVYCGVVDPPDAYAKALLVKLDSTGAVQWQQTYDSPGQSYEAISVAQYVDGGFVLAGYRLPETLDGLGFVIRTDSAGNEIWRRHFGDEGGGWCPVRVCADSGIVVYSSYAETGWPFGWWQNIMTKWNAEGNIVWQTRCNYFQNVTAYDLEVLPDQSIIGVGTYSTLIGLTKFSAEGDSLWCRWLWAMDIYSQHSAYDVELASDGGFLLTGGVAQGVDDPHPGQQTIFVIKTDSLGCVVPGCQNVGVQEYALDLQEHLVVAPNPATNSTTLELPLPAGATLEGEVRVLLLDATGRLVLEQRAQQNAQQVSCTLDVSALPQGLYYAHLRDERRWLAGSKVIVE